jgi:hypothetical protein
MMAEKLSMSMPISKVGPEGKENHVTYTSLLYEGWVNTATNMYIDITKDINAKNRAM